jgi:NOL1/NOP2/sun family putative RNA methylase
MSGRDFFLRRYKELGWESKEVELRQAIRLNAANGRPREILRRLESRGIALEKVPFLTKGHWVQRSNFSIGATAEYLLGLYSIQEAAAQIPATLFTDLRGKTVLDACAAPGGKTVQLADSMRNTGVIVALDVDKKRLTALTNHLERCHIKNTIVYQMDAKRASALSIKFDRILLDVPCSGNFAADAQWFSRRTMADVERNAALQREILAEAVKVLSPDGEIVYSTCSLEPEEDELNIDWAVKNLSLKVQEIGCHGMEASTELFGRGLNASVRKCRRIWPGKTQGFFVCKLRRFESS